MTSPLQAIKKKCKDCCCGSGREVTLCPCEDCPLWPFRFGTKPDKVKKPYIEYKPRKEGAIWAIRNDKWTKVIYIYNWGSYYEMNGEQFTELELAKQKAREEIKK